MIIIAGHVIVNEDDRSTYVAAHGDLVGDARWIHATVRRN